MAKILFLAGSKRKDSCNKKLAKFGSILAAEMGADATFIDLKDFDLPIFCEDFESENGMPENAQKLKKLFNDHDGFFIASPEYNSSFSALLKNTLDWLTRPSPEAEPKWIPFKGKTAAISGVSPGGLGGLRGLVPLRMYLGNIGVHVVPTQAAIGNGFNAYDEDGRLSDERQLSMFTSVMQELIETTEKLKN